MKRSILISLALHAAVLASVVWATERGGRPLGPPVRQAYNVDIVGVPGPRGGPGTSGAPKRPAKPAAPTPETDVVRSRSRTGLKVDKAPSNDPFSPKGTKKPARTPRQKPGQEGAQAGGGKGAPGGGGGGLRIEGEEPFPFPDYLQNLVSRIEEHWEVPLVVNQEVLKATVFFRILRDGTITDFRVESPSGLLPFDRSALNAVVGASPLPPLPEGFRAGHLGVYFDFEY